MINKQKLLAKMVEAGYTQKSLAKAVNMSKNTINAKLNGKGCFNTKQIELICEILNIISGQEKIDIFLANSSQNRDSKAS